MQQGLCATIALVLLPGNVPVVRSVLPEFAHRITESDAPDTLLALLNEGQLVCQGRSELLREVRIGG